MLPFRRFKDDAAVLDQCVTMIEDTVCDIEEYFNKDEKMTESLTETLSHLMDVYNETLDVLEDEDMTVSPRLHYRMYPTVRAYIRDSCNRGFRRGFLENTFRCYSGVGCIETRSRFQGTARRGKTCFEGVDAGTAVPVYLKFHTSPPNTAVASSPRMSRDITSAASSPSNAAMGGVDGAAVLLSDGFSWMCSSKAFSFSGLMSEVLRRDA